MRFDSIIQKLQRERESLDQLIACLERVKLAHVVTEPRIRKRRGRISMDEAERRQVSQRMTNYWAAAINRLQPGANLSRAGSSPG